MRGRTKDRAAAARRDAAYHTCWTFVLVVWCCCAPPLAYAGLASTDATQERLIEVLYFDAAATDGLDANTDGAITVADILVLSPRPTPTPTGTPTATATATPTETQVGTLFTGTVSDLIPHGMGDILYYKVTDGFGQVAKGSAETVSSEPSGVFRVIIGFVDSQNNINPSEANTYLDAGTVLSLTGTENFFLGSAVTCTPHLLQLKIPVIAGQTFTTRATCAGTLGGTTGVKYLRTDSFTPIEIVASWTVPAGTYTNVLHVSGTIAQGGFPLELDDIYVAPGIGVIYQTARAQNHLIVKRELMDGTVGGQSVKRP